MDHDGPFAGQALPADENISGTSSSDNEEFVEQPPVPLEQYGCAFIRPARWLAGKPPFCGQPVLPGSPYCRQHQAICRGRPKAAAR